MASYYGEFVSCSSSIPIRRTCFYIIIIRNIANMCLLVQGAKRMSYIDIHSHILPGLDDGSRGMQQSLDMLRIAEEEGI